MTKWHIPHLAQGLAGSASPRGNCSKCESDASHQIPSQDLWVRVKSRRSASFMLSLSASIFCSKSALLTGLGKLPSNVCTCSWSFLRTLQSGCWFVLPVLEPPLPAGSHYPVPVVCPPRWWTCDVGTGSSSHSSWEPLFVSYSQGNQGPSQWVRFFAAVLLGTFVMVKP